MVFFGPCTFVSTSFCHVLDAVHLHALQNWILSQILLIGFRTAMLSSAQSFISMKRTITFCMLAWLPGLISLVSREVLGLLIEWECFRVFMLHTDFLVLGCWSWFIDVILRIFRIVTVSLILNVCRIYHIFSIIIAPNTSLKLSYAVFNCVVLSGSSNRHTTRIILHKSYSNLFFERRSLINYFGHFLTHMTQNDTYFRKMLKTWN